MLLSDGNLREINFIIRAHGERWDDDNYHYNTIMASESRLFFILKGSLYYEIDGKNYTVTENQIMLLPQNRQVKFGVPKGSFVHMHYCNFIVALHNECLFDNMKGDWVSDVENPEETKKRFSRFHYVNEENLILDCIEKRYCLISVLLEFIQRSNLQTINHETQTGYVLNGIAHYIKRVSEQQTGLSVNELARMANIHPHYFITCFKAKFGKTPMQYASDCKLAKSIEFLTNTNLSITEISANMGFQDPKYFSKFFKRRTGQTPTEYRKSHILQSGHTT